MPFNIYILLSYNFQVKKLYISVFPVHRKLTFFYSVLYIYKYKYVCLKGGPSQNVGILGMKTLKKTQTVAEK